MSAAAAVASPLPSPSLPNIHCPTELHLAAPPPECSATAPDAALLLPAGFNGAEVTGHTLHDVFCDDPKRQSLNRRTSHNIYAYDLSPLQHGKVRGHLASTSHTRSDSQ